jgi:4-oxalocrotonate tautomerase
MEIAMPLARIDLVQGKSDDYRRTVGDVVYEAMVDILKAPKDDRFQVINEHPPQNQIADENFGLHARLGHRREDVFISLVEVAGQDWSFGNGEAQIAT